METEGKSIKIIFVEDLPADVEIARRVISKEKIVYTYKVVDNEFDLKMSLTDFRPDLIISDYSMPSFDGMSALNIVRSNDKNIPFIILTGSMNEETAVACMKAGANDYVIKEHINRLPFAITEAMQNKEARIERDRIEKQLRESEEKFRGIFQNHSAIKLIFDPDTGGIAEANQAAADFYGWSVAELENMNISEINTLPPDEHRNITSGIGDPGRTHFEFRHRKADGSLCFVETFSSKIRIGEKDYVHAVIHDVSERREAEKQLKLLSRSVEQSRISIIITDKKGIIEYVNPFFLKVTGYSLGESIGENPSFLKSGHQSEKFYKNLWDTILSGRDWNGELLNKKKDGSLYWENAVISPIVDTNNEITHFIAVKEDITEKKQMIQDLVKAKEKAEESDRLKSAFLANMSHEIRTPMNGILGFLDLLQNPELTSEQRDQYMNIVRESSDRLLNTIQDLIEISKIESGITEVKKSDVKLIELFNYIQRFFEPEASKKGLSFSVSGQSVNDTDSIYTDKYKLESVIVNLIKNAIKFTVNGFVEVAYSISPGEDMLHISVKDSGQGIPEDRKQAIFNRFEQGDLNITRPYEGSGLGLSIVKAYVEMLEGRITIESETDKGSTFIIDIPFNKSYTSPEREISKKSSHPENTDNQDRLILVVEDDEASQAYLKRILGTSGFRTLSAENGEEAVKLVKDNPGIDLVLMDIKLPVMNGYDATRQIKIINRDIPVIAQTAYAFYDDEQKAFDAGCIDYIVKPIKQEELLSIIGKYL